MTARSARALASVLAFLIALAAPGRAARPLLDQHQWDSYFATFARDSYVPWQPATIRLDTYSGAPVDLAVYNVDPAAVIVAGQNRPARALDTAKLRPLARWRFDPPPGYRFVSSDVTVPLGAQEGFYVVEARRGDAVQQVWLNRTHVGLVTEESPQGLVLWAADLRSGRAIANMRVEFLVGLDLVAKTTAADGTIVWNDARRPVFALAASGAGRAFVSLLPSAPLPATIASVRLAEAVVRAGGHVRAIGFARRLGPGGYRRSTGAAKVTLTQNGRAVAVATTRLDDAGAFDVDLPVPAGAPAGAYAVLANAGGGITGTAVQVDAAADVALAANALCPCEPDRPVTIAVTATREGGAAPLPVTGLGVRVRVVRIPHVLPPGASADAPLWGTTTVADRRLATDVSGTARLTLQPPTDGLDSTYAVRATTAGASATARVVVPASTVALSLVPDATQADPGSPVGFDVRAFRIAGGAPASGLNVTVRLSHGSTQREVRTTLGQDGRRRVSIPSSLGHNLALASATAPDGRKILDAASVDVAPRALSGGGAASSDADLTIATDRARYGPHDRVAVRASAPGASGDALLAIAGARTYALRVTSAAGGRASAALDVGDAQGDVRLRVAFVRNGAIAIADVPLTIDGPGRARATDLVLDRDSYAPGDTLHAALRDGVATNSGLTVAARVADGRTDGPAYFGDAPDVLSTGGTSAQAPASDNVSWHAWIAPSRSKASDLFGADRGSAVGAEVPGLGLAAAHALSWQIARDARAPFDIVVPRRPGRYELSVLTIAPSGDVGAAQASFEVR